MSRGLWQLRVTQNSDYCTKPICWTGNLTDLRSGAECAMCSRYFETMAQSGLELYGDDRVMWEVLRSTCTRCFSLRAPQEQFDLGLIWANAKLAV